MSMGGNLGGGGFFGGENLGPRGPYGAWPGCGCSTIIILFAICVAVFGGCVRMLGF